MSLGIVVLGHGSRASLGEANQIIFQITDRIKALVGSELVEPAIMNRESKLNDIDAAVEKLVSKGGKSIIIAPLFLANGIHIQQDIPKEIARLENKYPFINIKMARHIGADSRIAEILLERIQEVLK